MLERKKKGGGQEDALKSGRNVPTVRQLSEIIFLIMDHGCQITMEKNPMLYNIFAKKNSSQVRETHINIHV